MTHDEIIAVVTAHRDGKAIQWKGKNVSAGNWVDNVKEPAWDFMCNDYRVKPEPRELWVTYNNETDLYCGGVYNDELGANQAAYKYKRVVRKFVEAM